jgi:hypothetical protein
MASEGDYDDDDDEGVFAQLMTASGDRRRAQQTPGGEDVGAIVASFDYEDDKYLVVEANGERIVIENVAFQVRQCQAVRLHSFYL